MKTPKILFCIVEDTNGGHEPNGVYSIWRSEKDADNEIERLKKIYPYESFYYVEVELNKSYSEYIG